MGAHYFLNNLGFLRTFIKKIHGESNLNPIFRPIWLPCLKFTFLDRDLPFAPSCPGHREQEKNENLYCNGLLRPIFEDKFSFNVFPDYINTFFSLKLVLIGQ